MEVRRFSEGRFSGLGEEHPQGCWIKSVDFDRIMAESYALQLRLNAVEEENDRLRSAAQKVIDMNRQHAEDQYGDAEKAEAWSCVTELRNALENRS